MDTLIAPWKPPADDPTPFATLTKVVKAYKPGQGFIDGGGFQVVKESDTYLYVQFEALKKGFVDDLECYLSKDGMVMVRSSSRVGVTDFGVNAIRLNYIADSLREMGWKINELTPKVSGWGVYCCDFRRLAIASCCFLCLLLVCRRSMHT